MTTKLMPARASARAELEKSLERLGLDYVDLYLIHWPLPLLNARLWRELESLRERRAGRRSASATSAATDWRRLIRGASRKPAVNQVQFSPFHYRRRLLDYCLEQGIVFEAYSPLERGHGLQDPTITAVAERLGRTPAQVMLRWAIQHQAVVIPKSSREERIHSNAHCSTSNSATPTCEPSTRSTAPTAARTPAASPDRSVRAPLARATLPRQTGADGDDRRLQLRPDRRRRAKRRRAI